MHVAIEKGNRDTHDMYDAYINAIALHTNGVNIN